MQFSVERRRTGEEQEKIRENSSDSISEILVEMKKRNRGIRRAFLYEAQLFYLILSLSR